MFINLFFKIEINDNKIINNKNVRNNYKYTSVTITLLLYIMKSL